jgi:PAP2 superfamily protein
VVAAFYFVCCLYVMALLQIYSDYRAQDYPPNSLVIDTGFDIIPRVDVNSLSDYWVIASIFLFFLRMFFTGHIQLITRRWLLVQGTLYLFRGFTVAVTTFPVPPESGGTPPLYLPSNPFLGALLILLGQEKTASDLIYSGHTTIWTTTAEFWIYYTREASGAAASVYYIFNALGILSLIATRAHQTVDVVLAFAIAKLFVFVYHVVVVLLRCDPLYSWLITLDNAPTCSHKIYKHILKRFDWKHANRWNKETSIPALSFLPTAAKRKHRAPFVIGRVFL